jgi:hypothetical protein
VLLAKCGDRRRRLAGGQRAGLDVLAQESSQPDVSPRIFHPTISTRPLAGVISQRRDYSTMVDYCGSRPGRQGPALTLKEAALLSREDEDDLAGLSWNWEGAYTFAVIDGIWRATVVGDPAAVLTADTADKLRQQVRADYQRRQQVPRTPATGYLSERMST